MHSPDLVREAIKTIRYGLPMLSHKNNSWSQTPTDPTNPVALTAVFSLRAAVCFGGFLLPIPDPTRSCRLI